MKISPRQQGVLILLFGIVAVSPDALLLRMLEKLGITVQIILFWKSIFKVVLVMGYILGTVGLSKTIIGMKNGPTYVLNASIFQTCMEFGFTNMFLETTVARALLFYSLNPLWSAIMGRVFLGDQVHFHTKVTLVFAFISIFFTFGSQIFSNEKSEGRASIFGDLIAIGTGLATSAYITTVRMAHKKYPDIYLVPATVIGSLFTSLVLLIVLFSNSNFNLIPKPDHSNKLDLVFILLISDALSVSIVYVCLTLASQYLIGAEVSLLTLLESILGPLLVFFIFGETPGPWTLTGGILLLLTLMFHEIYNLYLIRKSKNTIHENHENPITTPFLSLIDERIETKIDINIDINVDNSIDNTVDKSIDNNINSVDKNVDIDNSLDKNIDKSINSNALKEVP